MKVLVFYLMLYLEFLMDFCDYYVFVCVDIDFCMFDV